MIPFLILSVAYQNGPDDLKRFAISHVTNIKEYLSFAHFANWKEVFLTIGCFSIVLCSVLIIFLWFMYSIKTHQKRKVMGWIIPVIFLLSGLEAAASFYPYRGANANVAATSYFNLINTTSVPNIAKVGVFALLFFAFLASLFGLILAITVISRLIKVVRLEKEEELTEELEKAKEIEEQEIKEEEELKQKEAEKHIEKENLDKVEMIDLIRQIVREELDRKGSVPTQIVQNFYGYTPESIKEQNVEDVTEEIVGKVSEELKKEETTIAEETIKDEAAVESIAVEEVNGEKKPIIRIPFQQRMIDADKEMKANYNELKNELLSWGLKSRISNSGDTFRLHCKTYCKLTIAGKSLKLYLALNPKDYDSSTLPFQDVGKKNIYSEIRFAFKVRSGLSMRRAKNLIRDACEIDKLEQDSVQNIDWAEDLKNNYVESAVDDSEESLSDKE